MTALLPIAAAPAAMQGAERGWQAHLAALSLAAAAILVLFHRDAVHMASIWWGSSTYNHVLMIPPIIAWLVWQRLPELSRIAPRAWAPGLLFVAAGAFGWLLGEAGGVALARHAGLVLMLQGAVIACLGKAVARGLVFPLAFSLFLIPAGEELVPLLQMLTAHMAVWLTGLAGIPAHLEGIFIAIPNGYFEVAEACAGAKFLIAMAAYGALVAHVCFRSWPRRIAFMAAALVIPIVANGIRAFATIWVAHRTTADIAAGLDHVIYGGIFFALVMALIMAAGWPFFDRKVGEPWFDPARLRQGRIAPLLPVAAALIFLAAAPLLWSAAMAGEARPVGRAVLPDVPGWERVAPSGRLWQPRFESADALASARYRNRAGQEVDLVVAAFARQQREGGLVGFGQGASDGGWVWTGAASAPPGGRAERIGSHGDVREVLTFYRVGRILTGSKTGVKLETMKVRLLGGPPGAAAVLVSAEAPGTGLSARPVIDAFLADLGPVDRIADQALGR